MSKQNFINLGMSLFIFILILLTPRKDVTALVTLVLGSFIATISSGMYSIKLNYSIMDSLSSKYLIIAFLIGTGLEIIGMFTAKFLATFHFVFVPFSFYLLLSLMITLQLNNGINLYLSNTKSTNSQDPNINT